MRKTCLICVIALLFGSLSFAITEVQTSWYLGPVEPGPVPTWGESFSSSADVAYTLPGELVLESQNIDYSGWVKHVVMSDYQIEPHGNILPADIDGDGTLDLVGIKQGNGAPGNINVVWFDRDPGSPTGYTPALPVGSFNTGFMSAVATIWPSDMDGDGDIDVVVSGAGGLGWFENDGSGMFSPLQMISTAHYVYARPGDPDNDGDMDIVVQDAWSGFWGRLFWFENRLVPDGIMNFNGPYQIGDDQTAVWRINLADFNGDGRLDIQTSGMPIYVFLNSPSGFPAFTQVLNYMPPEGQADGSWPADFDRDGDVDILFCVYQGQMYWLENIGGDYQTWPRHDISAANGWRYGDGSMAIDLDIDGFMDALGSNSAVGWYDQSPPPPTFTERWVDDVYNSHWVYGVNLDEDQCQPDFSGEVDMDILVTQQGEFDWYENRMVTFYDTGHMESSILSAGSCACWRTFGWQDCVPEGYNVYYKVRASDDLDDLLNDTVPWIGPVVASGDSLSSYGVSAGTYFQYRIEFERGADGDPGKSPAVLEVWVDYDLSVPPEIVCPAAITVECNQSGGVSRDDPAIQGWLESAEASGGCDEQALAVTNDAPPFFPAGCAPGADTTVTFEAEDDCGNPSTCTSTVTVVDATPPALSGVPGNVTVECDSVPPPASPTAADICDASVDIAYSQARTDGDCLDSYTLTRTWTATDNCNNSRTETQVITVQDTTPPVLSGVPTNVTVECDSVPEPAVPTAVDNCAADVDIVYSETRTDGDCPYNYTLTRTWTATDGCANVTVGTQVITVQDTTAPQLSCSFEPVLAPDEGTDEDSDEAIDEDGDETHDEYIDGLFTIHFSATDNCDANPTVQGYLDVFGTDETCDDENPGFIGYPVNDGDRVRLNCSKEAGPCSQNVPGDDEDEDEASDVTDFTVEITGPAMRLIVIGEDACFNRAQTECIYRCPDPDGCIDAITLQNSAGEQKTFYWYEFTGADMVFDVGGETGKFHVSCSKCLHVGDISGTLTITCIQAGPKLEKKCKVPEGTYSAPCP
jgi:hypothetical protein